MHRKLPFLALGIQKYHASARCLFTRTWPHLYCLAFIVDRHLGVAGSPVLGYLAAGVLIGPYALSIIKNVHGTRMIAEFGVVFLLFNIGLEVFTTALLNSVHVLYIVNVFVHFSLNNLFYNIFQLFYVIQLIRGCNCLFSEEIVVQSYGCISNTCDSNQLLNKCSSLWRG